MMPTESQPPASTVIGFGAAYAVEQIRRSRHPARRFVKGFYLRSVLERVCGPTIDYGCGAGQLLRRLPAGSIGLELNPHLVRALSADGLNVKQWSADEGGFDLPGLDSRGFQTLVISHVLEHLPDPDAALRRLMRACCRIGVKRLIAIVPGRKGYESDSTHRCFVDHQFVEVKGWSRMEGFGLTSLRFFPLPWAGGGAHFVYNEMQLVFDQRSQSAI